MAARGIQNAHVVWKEVFGHSPKNKFLDPRNPSMIQVGNFKKKKKENNVV